MYLSGFRYRKLITIGASSSGAMTNYQMMLTINRSTGSDSGSTVYISTKCESDYKDIRFTKSDGITLLDYWIESSSSSTASVWIKFDSIPATVGATFYIYYGNSSATSLSNGDNTFVFFDHFDTTFNTPTKWTGDVSKASVASSILTYDGDGGNYSIIGNISTPSGKSFALRTYANIQTAYRALISSSGDNGGAGVYCLNELSPKTNFFTRNGGNEGWGASNWTLDAWKIFDVITNYNVNSRLFENGVERSGSPRTTDKSTNTGKAFVYSNRQSGSEYPILIDWILLRNYDANEPTWGSWGTEEISIGSGFFNFF